MSGCCSTRELISACVKPKAWREATPLCIAFKDAVCHLAETFLGDLFQWTQGTAMLQLPALVSQSTALAALQLNWEAPSQMLLPLMHGWKQLVFYIPVQVRWIPYQYSIAPWERPTSAIARLTR